MTTVSLCFSVCRCFSTQVNKAQLLQKPVMIRSVNRACFCTLLKIEQNRHTTSVQHIFHWTRSKFGGGGESGLSKAVSEAEKIVGYPPSFLNLRCLLSDELSNIALHMRKLVGTKHPLLKTARGLVFDSKNNMQMRGLLVMLISKAAGPNQNDLQYENDMISGVHSSQRSLAEITEVIYTASLIHKGVVNLSELLPEDGPLQDMETGNKMAVLSGDYLLASACTGLAKLNNPLVVEKIASAISDIMQAEFSLFSDSSGRPRMPPSCNGFSDWLSQTYLSIGSLLAKSCQSAMTLAGHSEFLQSKAFEFGENISYAYGIFQDTIPFIKQENVSNLSLTSAPIFLYKEIATVEEFDFVQRLWNEGPTSFSKIVKIIKDSGVIEQCIDKLEEYRDVSLKALDCLQDSEAKTALINMAIGLTSTKS